MPTQEIMAAVLPSRKIKHPEKDLNSQSSPLL